MTKETNLDNFIPTPLPHLMYNSKRYHPNQSCLNKVDIFLNKRLLIKHRKSLLTTYQTHL